MTNLNPVIACLHWFAAPRQHYLRWGIALSLCVHAAFLVWRPSLAEREAPSLPNLEVVLVNSFTELAPLAPQLIAQENLDGGGDQSERIASNPTPRVGQTSEDLSLAELSQMRQQQQAEQTQLLKQLESSWAVASNQLQGDISADEPAIGPDQTDQRAIERNARLAAIREQIEQYNSRPRKHFDAPSAIANPFAAYVDAWRAKVEQTGSEHYPSTGGQRPNGKLQATVIINANGQVVAVEVDRPSSDVRLNQAVRRIIELAQPFAPFPAHLAQQVDQLVITRTWVFTPGSLTTRSP
jgi:periplasmic protein TonB